MAKAAKKQKPQGFEKEYGKVMKGLKTPIYQTDQQQWTAPGDFFIKFSLYKESRSGATSSSTTYISQ